MTVAGPAPSTAAALAGPTDEENTSHAPGRVQPRALRSSVLALPTRQQEGRLKGVPRHTAWEGAAPAAPGPGPHPAAFPSSEHH